jgi:hypothetical protein
MKGSFRLVPVFCALVFVFSPAFSAPAVTQGAGGHDKTTAGLSFGALSGAATGYLKYGSAPATGIDYGAFDEFSNVNDPLFREGAREFLKANSLNDQALKTPRAPVLRDAPSDRKIKTAGKKLSSRQKNKPASKKRKTVRSPHAGPVKTKNIMLE